MQPALRVTSHNFVTPSRRLRRDTARMALHARACGRAAASMARPWSLQMPLRSVLPLLHPSRLGASKRVGASGSAGGVTAPDKWPASALPASKTATVPWSLDSGPPPAERWRQLYRASGPPPKLSGRQSLWPQAWSADTAALGVNVGFTAPPFTWITAPHLTVSAFSSLCARASQMLCSFLAWSATRRLARRPRPSWAPSQPGTPTRSRASPTGSRSCSARRARPRWTQRSAQRDATRMAGAGPPGSAHVTTSDAARCPGGSANVERVVLCKHSCTPLCMRKRINAQSTCAPNFSMLNGTR
jgi:hypothetical protein